MNLLKFIESFTDDSLYTGTSDRRQSFTQFGKLGKNLALASIPFGLSALGNKATAADIGPTPMTAVGALQLALTLEYLEDEFYDMGLQSGVIPSAVQPIFAQISKHENAHVAYIKAALESLSATVPAKPEFDFTVGGAFDPFNETIDDAATAYAQFLVLSQAFEDTGVRAYKGQAGYLQSEPALLTAALRIHSVEAKHASQVRRLRGQKGWISGSMQDAGMPAATQAVYNGEGETMQLGFNTATVNNGSLGPAIPAIAGSESYDEVLTTQQSVDIANLFIV